MSSLGSASTAVTIIGFRMHCRLRGTQGGEAD